MPKISKTKVIVKSVAQKPHEVSHSPEEVVKKHARTPQTVRGMKDLLPYETPWFELIRNRVSNLARTYNFENIETPIVEESALFIRSIGKDTDIVEKEMYPIADPEGEKLVLY